MRVSSEVGGVCGGLFKHVGLDVIGKRAVGTKKKKPDVHRGIKNEMSREGEDILGLLVVVLCFRPHN